MKVLLWMPSGESVPGGHRVQLEKTAEGLRRLNANVITSVSPAADTSGFDVVHGFGLNRMDIRVCRAAGAKVALSTIYWSLDYTRNQRTWPTRVRFGLVLLRASLEGRYRDKCRAMTESLNEARTTFEMADTLLPNSQGEADCIRRELGVTTPMHVVPNAVNDTVFTPPAPGSLRTIDILYCGRFEPHKNQLGFIRAMRGTPWRTVVAGPPHPDHADYYRRCQREATGSVSVIPGMRHDQLPDLYRQAVVHALPSWYETTGLVSLEAALCGCRIVTTDRGFTRDYFGDFASYCDPSSRRSLCGAVAAAMTAGSTAELRDRILRCFTWNATAKATLEAYESLVA